MPIEGPLYIIVYDPAPFVNPLDRTGLSCYNETMTTDAPSRRDRQVPYRILAWILFSEASWLEESEDRVVVTIGPLARSLRTTNHRTREYLEWLQLRGYICGLDHERGRSSFLPILPKRNTFFDTGVLSNASQV